MVALLIDGDGRLLALLGLGLLARREVALDEAHGFDECVLLLCVVPPLDSITVV